MITRNERIIVEAVKRASSMSIRFNENSIFGYLIFIYSNVSNGSEKESF